MGEACLGNGDLASVKEAVETIDAENDEEVDGSS